MSLRDTVRAATLSQDVKFKSKIVEYNGIEVEIRQPSVKSRDELFKKCVDEDGKVNTTTFLAYGVINNTFIPGTNELIYEDSDYDVMVSKPAGGFLDKFGAIASELLNVDDDIEKKSEASQKTQKK